MSRKRCVETITKTTFYGYNVRVWTNCEQPDRGLLNFMGPGAAVMVAVIRSRYSADEDINGALERLRDELEKLSHVVAYEIVDAEGNGVIVHPDSK